MTAAVVDLRNDRVDGAKLTSKPPALERRRPPAYQTYASDDLASEAYYGLSLASRGLFDAMLRAIWVNGYVPREPRLLARAVRADVGEVEPALIPALLDQFVTLDPGLNRLTHPELDRQRARLEDRREKQKEGGKEGAKRRYSRPQANDAKDLGQPMGPEEKRTEQN